MEEDRIFATAASVGRAVKEIESITGKSVRTFRYEPQDNPDETTKSIQVVFDFADKVICPVLAPASTLVPE